jgi:peroxiredoxin
MTIFKKASIAILVLLLIAFFAYQLNQQPSASNAVFTTIKGEEISMKSLKGKVVLVNFWATDCKNCVSEMPDLINTYKQYHQKGLEIIAVSMPYDPPAQLLNFVNQNKLPFPVTHDSYAEIVHQFGGINVTPTTYLYNKEGKRIQRAVGTINFNKLHAVLDKELG